MIEQDRRPCLPATHSDADQGMRDRDRGLLLVAAVGGDGDNASAERA
jgi:hypothetical protein